MTKSKSPAASHHERHPSEPEKYLEEKTSRAAQLRAARALNRITAGGVIAGFITLLFLGISLWQARTTLEIDQRAWISVNGITPHTPYSPDHLALTFIVVNSGKTPAYLDRTVTRIGSSAYPFQHVDWFNVPDGGQEAIPPNGRSPITIVEGRTISDEEFQRLQTGEVRHDFDFSIYYHDAFGHAHITEVCVALEGKIENLSNGQILPTCGPARMT